MLPSKSAVPPKEPSLKTKKPIIAYKTPPTTIIDSQIGASLNTEIIVSFSFFSSFDTPAWLRMIGNIIAKIPRWSPHINGNLSAISNRTNLVYIIILYNQLKIK